MAYLGKGEKFYTTRAQEWVLARAQNRHPVPQAFANLILSAVSLVIWAVGTPVEWVARAVAQGATDLIGLGTSAGRVASGFIPRRAH